MPIKNILLTCRQPENMERFIVWVGMLVAFADGRLDVCSQYTTFGGPPPPEQGASTHHQFFSPDLEFLEKKIVSDTPHFCGTSMIYLDSIYYFISASAYTGNVIVMSYDK